VRVGKGVALLALAAGAALGAAALGLLPPRYVILDAPREVVGAAGGVLAFAGLAMLARDHRGSDLLSAFVLLGLSILTGWVTLYGPEGLIEEGFEFIPTSVREALGQSLFGIGLLLCGLMAFLGLRRLVR